MFLQTNLPMASLSGNRFNLDDKELRGFDFEAGGC